MRVIRALSTMLLLAWSTAAPANGQDQRIIRLREYLTAAANLGHLNASVLIAERGKVLVDTAYGFANVELGVRNTPDTRFRVASVTKQFTAMAIVMLAEDGKLKIADPPGAHPAMPRRDPSIMSPARSSATVTLLASSSQPSAGLSASPGSGRTSILQRPHPHREFRAALLPESAQDYFVAQLNGTARFRESDSRTTLVIEDALGGEVVWAVRERR